jgi:hypothetical protein
VNQQQNITRYRHQFACPIIGSEYGGEELLQPERQRSAGEFRGPDAATTPQNVRNKWPQMNADKQEQVCFYLRSSAFLSGHKSARRDTRATYAIGGSK